MMMDNHFILVGEGLVGWAAVSGNHQWINSKSSSIDVIMEVTKKRERITILTWLLIWKESYYETSTFSGIHGTSGFENPGLAFQDWSACSLHLLVNKMMMDNQFILVGEGLDGRAAVTGNHQWILSKSSSIDVIMEAKKKRERITILTW